MNKYYSRCIEKYIGRKFFKDEISLETINDVVVIKEWNITDKTKPIEADLLTIFNTKEKEIYQDILINELDNVSFNIFIQELFDNWKLTNETYKAKLAKIMGATKAKLLNKIENKVEL